MDQIQKKLMTQSSNKFKKRFLTHFPNVWDKKNFLENLALLCTTSTPCQNLEKVNNTIQRKCLDRQTEGWADAIL